MDLSHGRYWDESWSPVRGCVPCGARCWASRMAQRFSGPGQPYEGLTKGGVWTGEQRFVPGEVDRLLAMRKPRVIAVGWMGDIHGPGVSWNSLDTIYAAMVLSPQHTFLVLSKYAENRCAYWNSPAARSSLYERILAEVKRLQPRAQPTARNHIGDRIGLPSPHVWQGSSVLTQAEADRDIPVLLATPAAHRWASLEPMLERIDLDQSFRMTGLPEPCPETADVHPLVGYIRYEGKNADLRIDGCLNAVVCGGESGPRARPCDVAWLRSVAEQCKAAGAPRLTKQLGSRVLSTCSDDLGYEAYRAWDDEHANEPLPTGGVTWRPRDGHGADASDWPVDLERGSVPWA